MNERTRNNIFILTGFAVLCFAAITWYVGADLVGDSEPRQTNAQVTSAESGAVSVLDQPAGSYVAIESITVPAPGVWIAVRETAAGQPGNILGARRVRGPMSAVSVPLLRPTTAGNTYMVELYRDDGDSTFNKEADSVYVDYDTGEPVRELFMAK